MYESKKHNRTYFNFPMMPREEYSAWIDRIVSSSLLEDIIHSCELELHYGTHISHHYPPDVWAKKLKFYQEVKEYAAGRALELAANL